MKRRRRTWPRFVRRGVRAASRTGRNGSAPDGRRRTTWPRSFAGAIRWPSPGAAAESPRLSPRFASEAASSAPGRTSLRKARLAAGPPLSPAAQAYRKGDVAALAALAEAAGDPDERLALEWAALRADPHPAFAALEAFAKAHPTWPGLGYLRYRQEAELLVHPPSPSAVSDFFAADPPQSSAGSSRSRARQRRRAAPTRRSGSSASSGATAISTPGPRASILRDFGVVLLKSDHKYRADRLLYAENYAAAFRAAALAGPDEIALAQARAAAARGPLTAALVKAVPPALKDDPGLLFARVQDARRVEPRLRGGDAAQSRAEAIATPSSIRTNGGPSGGWSRASCSTSTSRSSPSSSATRRRRPDDVRRRGRSAISTPAGSRCASSATPARPPSASLSPPRPPRRLCRSRAPPTGAAAPPRRWATRTRRGSITRAPRASRSPITDSSPPSVSARSGSSCARRARSPRAPSATRRCGRRKRSTPTGSTTSRPRSPSRRRARWRDEAQMAAMAEVVKRHADAATQVQFGKIATLRGYAFDAMAFPSVRRAGLPAARPFGRPRQHLRGRAAGERIRLACGVRRGRQGAHADPAFDRGVDREARRRRLRLRPAPRRSRLQHPARRGLPRPGDGGRRRLARNGLRRLQRRPRAGGAMDRRLRRSAQRTPIRSTGSSASRSTRRATTCSGSARTSASTASASTRTRRRSASSRRGWRRIRVCRARRPLFPPSLLAEYRQFSASCPRANSESPVRSNDCADTLICDLRENRALTGG